MMKKMSFARRGLLCLLLALSLLFGLVACVTDPETTGAPTTVTTAPSTAPSTAPTTRPTTAPTTVPTTATPTTQPVIVPQREPLVFTLIPEDVELFYTLLESCETLSIAGEDLEAIEEVTVELDEQFSYLNAQYSIANILYCCNMEDATLREQYLNTAEICTEASDAYIQMTRRVYQSDSPVKDVLFAGWTEEDLEQLMAYDEQIAQLRTRNDEITVEYREAILDKDRIALYIEFVQNNNQIAQIYGYNNYYEYAYKMEYGRDYDPELINEMRQYAKDYIVPVFDTSRTNFYSGLYGLNDTDRNAVIGFLNSDYDDLSAGYVNRYLEQMPQSMSDPMVQMITKDSVFATSADARTGAFTTMIGDRSYCYFGPGYANSCTVVHEAGHYYASRFASFNSMSLDLAETHSQGNEWLFMHFVKDYMPASQYDVLLDYRLYNDLAMTMVAMMVDEFEQKVYTTDLTGYTAEDFDALMDSVVSQYFSLSYAKVYLMDMKQYWRAVVVDQPVYYISYAVSAIAAMDLYTVAREDFDKAVGIYQKLCEEPDLEKGFLGNISAVDLSGPFDETFYQELVEIINSRK